MVGFFSSFKESVRRVERLHLSWLVHIVSFAVSVVFAQRRQRAGRVSLSFGSTSLSSLDFCACERHTRRQTQNPGTLSFTLAAAVSIAITAICCPFPSNGPFFFSMFHPISPAMARSAFAALYALRLPFSTQFIFLSLPLCIPISLPPDTAKVSHYSAAQNKLSASLALDVGVPLVSLFHSARVCVWCCSMNRSNQHNFMYTQNYRHATVCGQSVVIRSLENTTG